jgi:hypothetical protein
LAGIEPLCVAQPQSLKFDAVFPVDSDGYLPARVHEDKPAVRPDPGFQQRLKIRAVKQIRAVPQDKRKLCKWYAMRPLQSFLRDTY